MNKLKTSPNTVKYEIVFDFLDTKAELRIATGNIIPCSTTDNHSGYHCSIFRKCPVNQNELLKKPVKSENTDISEIFLSH